MAGNRWRIASGLLLVPVAVAGLAACGGGSSSAAASGTASAKTASDGGLSSNTLRSALLTQVNGVAAAAPAATGKYSSSLPSASKGKQTANTVQVTPKTCTQTATSGFNPTALAGSPAAAVTFQVGTNGVSEVLIASNSKSATTALATHVPTECAQYQEKVGGKSFSYGLKEQSVSGIGKQAKLLNLEAKGAKADDMWSVIYQGTGFVGTVTVVGPNASKQAATELGQQAYAFATKALS
jgi:hypothetical protein